MFRHRFVHPLASATPDGVASLRMFRHPFVHPLASLWLVAAALLAAGGALAQDQAPADEESAKDIVATTVRAQGHPCDQPQRAVRDEAASAPDRAVWVLECANASYRVRYDNDVPAEVRRLD
jgi:hypothetical protein